ncbi:conserved membrane hypothetical protein [Nostocoides japonicum T1-X7]|uniref:EamA domain-containing protein n=1 Tax=Nostocoides japonicum T1-X7 TaxID=1194083 RepID=A0A077LXC5_9MICO|nr:EamA family transporter [Tetrasphaera japonica]CCH78336.1 conserved membrane hypothetical protein [Tetrasphaera japonica T1-X7]
MTRLRQATGSNLALVAALLSAFTFATSGPAARSLLEVGWSPGAVVLLRLLIACLILLPAAVVTLHGRWHLLSDHAWSVVAYGVLGVALCQVCYFQAVRTVAVGVALLLEYLAIVLVVVVSILRTRRLPSRLTTLGMVLSVIGLVLVLDLLGVARPATGGVLWALFAALGLAGYFLVASEETGLPPVALAGFGMLLGAVALGLLGALGVLSMDVSSRPVHLAGHELPWWVSIVDLAVMATAAAYFLGIVGARGLGATVASFVGLTEVVFAVLVAWVLLGQLPRPVQLIGGVIVLAGVVAVRLGAHPVAEVAPEPLPKCDADPEPVPVCDADPELVPVCDADPEPLPVSDPLAAYHPTAS